MNERSIKRMLLVTLVLSAMVLSGFAVLSGNAAASSYQTKATTDTLIVAFQNDIVNLNIFDPNSNSVWKFDALGWSFEGLMAYTPDLIPYPVLAQNYTVDTPDGLNVTVYLRQNAHFQDGTPVTAKDVVFSFQTLYWDPLYQTSLKCLYWSNPIWPRWDGNGTSHIGVVADPNNPYAVHFHLSRPYPLFYHVTLGTTIIPEHIWKDHLISANTGDSDDMTIDTSWSDPKATIGTGAFKFVEWQPGSYVVIERYDDYWGKGLYTEWQNKKWPWFPQYVKKIVFKIYNQLDVAALALKSGEVHFIDWSVPPGYYEQFKTVPGIGSQVVDDQGFFYLAFNMRKAPMNDLAFRTAVAHAINKDYIVTTLMQGYGIKGTVPISITSGAYVNTSAIPPDFDLDAARQVLANAGYKDVNGDGWLEAPDGSPIKETILTPPKDYDPVRAEAGIMMQTNLQKIGLNIQSSPTAFDTIVSKVFVQVNFDMYVLGWGVGSFPETYLYDFFHSSQKAPIGYNTPGYSNPKVDKLLDEIEVEMDTAKRIQMVKDVEGILVHDLPYDTLYYRKNIMCYRKDVWQGWVPAFGTIFNGFSINTLYPAGSKPPTPPAPVNIVSNGVTMHAYLPDTVYAGTNYSGVIYVTDYDNMPLANVPVKITTSYGDEYVYNTSSDGSVVVDFKVPYMQYGKFNLTYATAVNISGTVYTDMKTKSVTVLFPKHIAKVTLSIDKKILTPGESATITAKVTDRDGNPMSGVNVTILTQEVAGNITPSYGITNANGEVTFAYTAPTHITNINAVDVVKAQISVGDTILTELQSTTLLIPIQTTGSTGWYKAEITGVSTWSIEAGQSTQISVKVVDLNGNPVSGHDVYIEAIYSNATDPNWYGEVAHVDTQNISFDATQKTTDANGEAVFTMTALNNTNRPYIVKVYTQDTYGVYDAAVVYVGNITPLTTIVNNHTYVYNTTTGNITWTNTTQESSRYIGFDPWIGAWTVPYGMIMNVDVTSTSYGQTVSVSMNVYYAMNVTVQTVDIVYNASSNTTVSQNVTTNITHYAGDPASGVISFLAVFGTDYGFGADWTSGGTYVWWAGQSFIVGTTDANGTFGSTLTTYPLRADQAIYISGWVDAYGYGTSSKWTGLGFQLPYLFGIKNGFILTRAPIMGISSMTLSRPYLNDTYNSTTVTFTVVDANGALANVNVALDYKVGNYENVLTGTTDTNGQVSFNVSVPQQITDVSVYMSVMLSSNDHAMNLNYEYYVPYFHAMDQLMKTMVITNLKVTSSNGGVTVPSGGHAQISFQVIGGVDATPISGATVTIASPTGTLSTTSATTDENGYVSFNYTPPVTLTPSHYVVLYKVVKGDLNASGMVGIEVLGALQNVAPTQLYTQYTDLENQLSSLQNNYTTLQNEYSKLKDEKASAETMEYLFLGLTIILLIIVILLIVKLKKAGAPPAAPVEEEPTETFGEEVEETEPTEEETEATEETEESEESTEEESEEEL